LTQATAAALKERVCAHVESLAEDVVTLSQQVRDVPELGFAECRTRALVREWLTRHGVGNVQDLASTAVRVDVPGCASGPTVALLGELDAVHVPSHPDADPRTGAAHACGHHASLAAACGALVAVSAVMPELAGRLTFIGTPAEEMLPEPRPGDDLQPGQHEMPTGKAELIRLGAFEDVDMALMVHTGREAGPRFSVGDTLNAAVRVRAVFHGTAAHAGSSPWLGVDAVRAARLAMAAVDAQRELFPDTETVRIAQQALAPQAAPGAIPATCQLDVLIRARTLEALELALDRVDRALYSGAVAVGAGLTRTSELVYAPVHSSSALDDLVEANAVAVVGGAERARGRHLGASSDIGDLGLLMPVSHPYASGAVGHHHSPSFRVEDDRQATLEPALYLAMTVVDLLHGDARVARDVLAAASPAMSRADYLALRRRMSRTRDSWPELTRNADDRK
jgi:amidohydrolase